MIMHHKTLWIFIDEPKENLENCYSVNYKEWSIIEHLSFNSLKPLLDAQTIFGGNII